MNTLEKYCAEFIEKTFPEKTGFFSFIGRKKREQQKNDMYKLMATQFTTVASMYWDTAIKEAKVTLLNKCLDHKNSYTKKVTKRQIQSLTVDFKI